MGQVRSVEHQLSFALPRKGIGSPEVQHPDSVVLANPISNIRLMTFLVSTIQQLADQSTRSLFRSKVAFHLSFSVMSLLCLFGGGFVKPSPLHFQSPVIKEVPDLWKASRVSQLSKLVLNLTQANTGLLYYVSIQYSSLSKQLMRCFGRYGPIFLVG